MRTARGTDPSGRLSPAGYVARVLARFGVVAVAVVLAAAGLNATPAHAAPTTFQAATARVEITPTALGFPDYYRAGYGSDAPVHVTGGSPLFATGLLMVNSAG